MSKNKNKTVKKTKTIPDKDAIEKCNKKYCVNYTRKMMIFSKKVQADLTDFVDKQIDVLERKKNKTEIEKKDLEKKKKSKKNLEKAFKKVNRKSQTEKRRRETMKQCNKAYCNIGCKDTIFDKDIDLPSIMLKRFKGKPKALNAMRNWKKFLYKGKKNILKNESFYEGLKDKDIKRIQKEGALSGCAMVLLNNKK